MKRQKNWQGFSALFALVVIAAVSVILFVQMGSVQSNTEDSEQEILLQALRRAAVQCYALEGGYPPDVDYLIDHYGVVVDSDRYFVHYKLDAGNIMPDITVFSNLEDEG